LIDDICIRFDMVYQISVEEPEPVLANVSQLDSSLGSQALRFSSAWFRMEHHSILSSLESADSKCLMIVWLPWRTVTKLCLSEDLAGLRLSSRKVFIREQISLGETVTFSVMHPPRSILPMGSCVF